MPDANDNLECPYCGSQALVRIHRNAFEKLLGRNPKFRCSNCKRSFYKRKTRS